jgi:hypothetical protein
MGDVVRLDDYRASRAASLALSDVPTQIWLMWRAAALLRHWILVSAMHPEGRERDAAWAWHVAFVQSIYGF